jgi:ferric iron reductase protein FhuF
MKKKTISKKDKATLIAAEKAAVAQLKKDFKEMRKNNNYSEMGDMFFQIFCTEEETMYRKAAGKLWDSLTEEEQMMCEEC